jgi:hypothetical protein
LAKLPLGLPDRPFKNRPRSSRPSDWGWACAASCFCRESTSTPFLLDDPGAALANAAPDRRMKCHYGNFIVAIALSHPSPASDLEIIPLT